MKPEKSLISGSTAMLILKLLSEKDMYGYEMIETLQERSENPLRHGLEEKSFLTCYEQEAQGKVRKYYHITGTGRRELKEKKKAWETYARAVSNVLCWEGSL